MSEQELQNIERFAKMSDPMPGSDLWIVKASEIIQKLVSHIRNNSCSSHLSKVSSDPSGSLE